MVDKYHTTFLKQVIVRLDFTFPITKITKILPKSMVNLIERLFPISEPKKFIGKELLISKDATKEKILEGTEWHFHNIDKDKTLIVASDNINITSNKYQSFEILKGEFLPILDEFFSSYEDVQGKRLGLRYINEIILPENNVLDWNNYIDERLLSMLSFPEQQNTICRAFNNLELNYVNMILRFQYGILNPDYPVPVRKKNFILDYDAYYQGPQDIEDVKQNMDKFHEAIQRLFELSITDALRSVMGIEHNG